MEEDIIRMYLNMLVTHMRRETIEAQREKTIDAEMVGIVLLRIRMKYAGVEEYGAVHDT